MKVVPPTVPPPKHSYVVRMEIMSFEDVGSYLNQVDEKGARIMLRSSSIWMTDSTDDVDFDVDEDDFDDSDDSDLEDEDDEEEGSGYSDVEDEDDDCAWDSELEPEEDGDDLEDDE